MKKIAAASGRPPAAARRGRSICISAHYYSYVVLYVDGRKGSSRVFFRSFIYYTIARAGYLRPGLPKCL